MQSLTQHLEALYGEEEAASAYGRLMEMVTRFQEAHPELLVDKPGGRVDEKDAVLITYGDMVTQPGRVPLKSLASFFNAHLRDVVSTIHILPFYPYSSDDGFSVIDYHQVDPALGSWQDVAQLGQHFRLMFDAVINHISAQSDWFQKYLRDDPAYRGYFIEVDPETDLSQVFRPRALPLLTAFDTAVGRKHVWTTFSADQIDLNFRSSEVLLQVVRTLLGYVDHGAEFIRLDAIGFMWKEIGTSCIHLPEAHHIIQLLRLILDETAPHVSLITETNVPHEENISYFGDGFNEAQMVYNFSLPPLTLHAFHTGNGELLSSWAAGLKLPSDQVTFFNFLASHDGIGLMPLRGLLDEAEVTAMANRVRALGGNVSYKQNPDGSQSPYELNINFMDALAQPGPVPENSDLVAQRFLASQAIMLAFKGVPGIYFHSLFGSQSWQQGVEQTGRARSINREKLDRQQLEQEIEGPGSLRNRVFFGYRNLLRKRRATAAFHPLGEQQILRCHPSVVAIERRSPDGKTNVLCLHNVSGEPAEFVAAAGAMVWPMGGSLVDLLTGASYGVDGNGDLHVGMGPYGYCWLAPVLA